MRGSSVFKDAADRVAAELQTVIGGVLEVVHQVIDAQRQSMGSNACGVRTVLAVDTFLSKGALLLDVPWVDLPDRLDAEWGVDRFAAAYDAAQDDERALFCQLLQGVYAAHAAPAGL